MKKINQLDPSRVCGSCIHFNPRDNGITPCCGGGYVNVRKIGYPVGHLTDEQIKFFRENGKPIVYEETEQKWFIQSCYKYHPSLEALMLEILEEESADKSNNS